MDEIIRLVADHRLVAMGIAGALLLILCFLFMKLVKVVLILVIVAAIVGGYVYFQHPEMRPANLREAVDKVRTGTGEAVDKGKAAYQKGRELVEKGKKIVDKGKTVLEKGIDKGKDVIEGGKSAADRIGKTLGGEEKEP